MALVAAFFSRSDERFSKIMFQHVWIRVHAQSQDQTRLPICNKHHEQTGALDCHLGIKEDLSCKSLDAEKYSRFVPNVAICLLASMQQHDTRPKVLLESWPFLRRRGQLWRTWNQWLPVPWWRTMMKNIYKGFGVYLWDKFTVFCQNEMEKSSQQEWQAPWWFSNALGTRSVRKNVRFSGL